MKKTLRSLAVVLLTICLVGFAFDRIIPASTVQAGCEPQQELSSTRDTEKETLPLTFTAQPVVFVITGLVVVLFGILALSPLVIGDPTRFEQDSSQREISI